MQYRGRSEIPTCGPPIRGSQKKRPGARSAGLYAGPGRTSMEVSEVVAMSDCHEYAIAVPNSEGAGYLSTVGGAVIATLRSWTAASWVPVRGWVRAQWYLKAFQ